MGMQFDGPLMVRQVTERTGLSRKALRLYEERGFVVPDRTEAGYRLYGHEALRRLELIRRARHLEMTTRELGDFLDIAEGCCERDLDELIALVQDKLGETDRRLAELAELRHTLTATLATLHRDAEAAHRTQVQQCTDLLCTCRTSTTTREEER